MKLTPVCAALALSACGAFSDVTQIGPDSFMTTVHGIDVDAPPGSVNASVMKRATEFCTQRDSTVHVIRLDPIDAAPGQAPSAELDFVCDPRR